MTRGECLRVAEATLADAEKNLAVSGADLNRAIARGAVTVHDVAELTALQIQLAEAWLRLAREKATP